jgi:hypothetical protein
MNGRGRGEWERRRVRSRYRVLNVSWSRCGEEK